MSSAWLSTSTASGIVLDLHTPNPESPDESLYDAHDEYEKYDEYNRYDKKNKYDKYEKKNKYDICEETDPLTETFSTSQLDKVLHPWTSSVGGVEVSFRSRNKNLRWKEKNHYQR